MKEKYFADIYSGEWLENAFWSEALQTHFHSQVVIWDILPS